MSTFKMNLKKLSMRIVRTSLRRMRVIQIRGSYVKPGGWSKTHRR